MTDWVLVVQLMIGLLFGRAAAGKVTTPIAFANGVQLYNIVPHRIAFALGLSIIPAEIFVALTHVADVMMPAGAYVGILLSATFLIAVGMNVVRGEVVPCYCFDTSGDETVSWLSMARISGVLLCEGVVLSASFQSHTAEGGLGAISFVRWITAAICAVAALGACAWLLAIPRLIEMRAICTSCGNGSTEGVNT